jgi:2,3-diketo-5-methylthio-1-phosphopentane phosphatase
LIQPPAILQLDFDGTLVHGDINEALFQRFAGEEWANRIEAASHELTRDPSSPALIAALQAGARALGASDAECLAFAEGNNPPREGLAELIETAKRLDLECHVVSYGFDFYVGHYLRQAGVEDDVAIHCGETSLDGSGRNLRYIGPDRAEVSSDWKMLWTRGFRERAATLIYAGDGGSDLAPAQLCDIVFARDRLLERLPASYKGTLRPFETLHDITRGLEELAG